MLYVTVLHGPPHWASYLVNGDASSLTPKEKANADAWIKREGVRVLSVEGPEYYTRFLAFHCPEAGAQAGNIIDYIVSVEE